MILKNYKVLRMGNNDYRADFSDITITSYYKDLSGTAYNTLCPLSWHSVLQVYTPGIGLFTEPSILVRVGTGTTEVNIEDYCLENDVTASFSNRAQRVSHNCVGEESNSEITIYASGKNSTDSTISITEIGIVNCNMTVSTNIGDKWVLLFREVLSTPIVVPPNSTYHFTIVWTET